LRQAKRVATADENAHPKARNQSEDRLGAGNSRNIQAKDCDNIWVGFEKTEQINGVGGGGTLF